MRRIVAITGATGFIGRYLVRQFLQQGWHVRVLTRRVPHSHGFDYSQVDAVIGDLLDRHALARLVQGVDAIVHAAGVIKARTHAEYFAANAVGTRHLVEATIAQGGNPRFLLLSSIVARRPQISDYAASKFAGEAELTRLDGTLPWSIIRPPAVYGPGDRETLPFFRSVRRGLALMPPMDNSRLSLIHVSDLAAAAATAVDAPPIVHRTLEIDDGQAGGYCWRELVEIAGSQFDVRPVQLRIPTALLSAAAHANTLLRRKSRHPPMFTPGKLREILETDWVAHDGEFVTATGWRAKVNATAGFAETIAWYRSQGWL